MKKIQVLLSTYNGEKYLRALLDSLIQQNGVDLRILVRDDGSSDKTVKILEQYKSKCKLDLILGDNIGYQKSFMYLASISLDKADYYAFCDQDDIWDSEKIISAINILEEDKESIYKLYFSNLNVVDENLNNIGFKDYSKQIISLGSSFVRYNAAGCTMVFNNNLLKISLIKNLKNFFMSHDSWLYKVCLSIGGKIYFDSNSYILYRQHKNNVTGIRQGFIKRLISELKVFSIKKNRKLKVAKLIVSKLSKDLAADEYNFLYKVINYRDSFLDKIKLLFCKDLKSGRFLFDFFVKIQIIFGVF